MKIKYSNTAQKQFLGLSRGTQERIAKKMRFFASQENPLKFAKRLQETKAGTYRFRIGDYRIIFDIRNRILYILTIKHRSEVYE